MTVALALSLLTAAAVGSAAGYVGSLMVLRRMALVGDALSHVALPGLALGILLGFSPTVGAFALVLIAAVLTWWVERSTGLPVEGIVGVLFVLALAIGVLLTPNPDLLEALFGSLGAVDAWTTVATLVVAAAVVVTLRSIYRSVVLSVISPELAASAGIRTGAVSLLYLVLVSTTVAVGIQVSGTLLAGALVIVPAVTAKLVGSNLRTYTVLSVGFGVVSAVGGTALASGSTLPPGPPVVVVGVVLFAAALVYRWTRNWRTRPMPVT
ncbi:MAG: metal ABC transporter permease [Thermoplasmata archaeon]